MKLLTMGVGENDQRLTGSGRELDDFLTKVNEDLQELTRKVARLAKRSGSGEIKPCWNSPGGLTALSWPRTKW